MTRLPSGTFASAALVALALSPACGGGGDGGGGTTPPVVVTSVVITAPAAPPTFGALGRTVQFSAQARDAGGAAVAGASIGWSSSNPAAATVSAAGLVTAVANGSTQIRAASGTVQSSAVTVTVSQVAVTLTPAPTSVAMGALGSTRQLAATVADSGGAVVAGAVAAWTRIGPGTSATVSATGLVTATGVGTGDTAVASAGGLSAKVPIAVTQVAASIVVTSTSGTPDTLFTTGRQRQFSASARDSNANVLGTQPSFAWSSSATGVATVNAASGLVTSVADGSATITASGGGVNGTRALVVRRFPSVFTISPTSAAIATASGTQVFTGTAQDSSGANLGIAWASRNASLVSVSPASGTSTTATAIGNGTTYVVMTANARSDSAQVTVTNQPQVSFSGQVQPIFTASCALANCHTGATPTGSMNLTAGVARANIVNVNAVGAPGNIRVIPGNASNSYLIRKLEGGPNIVGGQMPDGMPPLSASTIQVIRAWIDQGALNN